MPTVFISYAREDEDLAEDIYHALERAGHSAILDKKALTRGEEFNVEIKRLIDSADFFVFLVSPEAVAQGAYARTELGFAEERWSRNRTGFLPVLVRDTDPKLLPAFIRQATWLKPLGNTTAEIVAELNKKQVTDGLIAENAMESRTERARGYFETSLGGRDKWYRAMSSRLGAQYRMSQAAIVTVALALPVSTSVYESRFVLLLQVVLSGLMVVSVVINLLGNFQVRALRYSVAAERMTREYRMYCNIAAPYTSGLGEQRAYQLFVETIEQIVQDAERE